MRFLVRLAVIITAAAAVAIGLFPHGFNHLIGVDTQGSVEYAYFSGFGAWLSSTLGLTTIIATMWHHLNCHVTDCLRVGKFPVAGGQYKVCGRHHGEITGRPHRNLTAGALRVLHLEHHRPSR
jgi:hypothetical protein